MIEDGNKIDAQVLEQARLQLENVAISQLTLQIAQLSRGDTYLQELMFKIILAEGHTIKIPEEFAKEISVILNNFLDNISASAHVIIPPEKRIEDINRIINYFEEESQRKIITYWQILIIISALITADVERPLQRNKKVSTILIKILENKKTNRVNTFWHILFLHTLSQFENSKNIKEYLTKPFEKYPEITQELQRNPLTADNLIFAIKQAQQKYIN